MKDTSKPWLDEWKDLDEIGQGGQGVVTELRHKTDPNRRAVLKRIVPRWQEDPQARQRLQQETETLQKLNELGARVPKVYDSFLKHDGAEPFLLMEFIEGVRFDKWLKNHAPTTPSEAVRIILGIADTIKLCHEHEIGHRDLKPANIILKNGEIEAPYVLDFGISFDSQQTLILTKEGETFRNEFITLPECQDLAGGHRDLRSDITALAGIFFSCLTGRPPLVLRDAKELAPQQKYQGLVLDCAETTEQGERLLWFFQRAFAYGIDGRLQTLKEFTDELQHLANPSPSAGLNLEEQFDILDQSLRSEDRAVQIGHLRDKYTKVRGVLQQHIKGVLSALQERGGQVWIKEMRKNKLDEAYQPKVKEADILDLQNVLACKLSPVHSQWCAVVLLTAFGVGMQIHLYAAAYTAPSEGWPVPKQPITWEKIAVVDENTEELSKEKTRVILDALKSNLAQGLAALRREKIK